MTSWHDSEMEQFPKYRDKAFLICTHTGMIRVAKHISHKVYDVEGVRTNSDLMKFVYPYWTELPEPPLKENIVVGTVLNQETEETEKSKLKFEEHKEKQKEVDVPEWIIYSLEKYGNTVLPNKMLKKYKNMNEIETAVSKAMGKQVEMLQDTTSGKFTIWLKKENKGE